MPLSSNSTQTHGTFQRWDPSGKLISDTLRTKYKSTFNVSPNPCRNVGNHKDPVPYSFSKTNEWLPSGVKTEWYVDNNFWNGSAWVAGVVRRYSSVGAVPLGPWYNYALAVPANDVYNRALAKLYDQMKDSEIGINTTVGEGRETLAMINSIAKHAAVVLKDLRGSKKRIGKILRDLGTNPLNVTGGVWLSWSVGLAPLLSDIENLRNHVLSEKAESVAFAVKSRSSWKHTAHIMNGVSDYYWPGDLGRYETLKFSEWHQLGVTFEIKDLHSYENWRAGLVVRPTLAWELLTLSFVVDYFFNIGQLLELLEASLYNNGLTFRSGYHTISTRESRTWALEYKTTKPITTDLSAETASLRASKEATVKGRYLLTQFPTPQMPILKLPKAAGALANCAALLANFIQRK